MGTTITMVSNNNRNSFRESFLILLRIYNHQSPPIIPPINDIPHFRIAKISWGLWIKYLRS